MVLERTVIHSIQEASPVSSESSFPDVLVTTKPKEREQTRTRRVPPYHVILENDDYHSMDFVVDVLRKVFGSPLERALQLMLQAHTTGRAIVWTGPLEVAELKADQIRTFHEIHAENSKDLGPLGCTVEPAPCG
jgi:ATP-dependent Clp protease adaptor protein ClpS